LPFIYETLLNATPSSEPGVVEVVLAGMPSDSGPLKNFAENGRETLRIFRLDIEWPLIVREVVIDGVVA
jgi:hypothetical protein